MSNLVNEFRFKKQNDKNIEMVDNNFENAMVDITVSSDGSRQKRGFSSLNGPVTLIASDLGKICRSWSTTKIMQFLFFMGTEETQRTRVN